MAGYVGKEACAQCHAGIAATAAASSMGRTAMHANGADVLHEHADMQFHFDRMQYRIQTKQSQGVWESVYSVGDGRQAISSPLLWIFGTGRVGQSYLYQKPDGRYFEARITFFQSLKNLGFTPARALDGVSPDVDTAAGRPVQSAELIRCFNCHATAVNIAGTFNERELMPGVTCEACHGPGANHVRLMKSSAASAQKGDDYAILNPSHMSPTESVEFCGSCHGSWWDVKLAHVTGPSTVRSAPYRLVTSKCWGKAGDPRLVCTACHDPHRELVTDVAAYDQACLQCHSNGVHRGAEKTVAAVKTGLVDNGPARGPACPVATSKCASCHMPQVFVPEMQNTFTDHRIRIVRAGEPFQD